MYNRLLLSLQPCVYIVERTDRWDWCEEERSYEADRLPTFPVPPGVSGWLSEWSCLSAGTDVNMDDKSNKLLLALVIVFLFAVIVLQYVCPGTECQQLRLQAFSSSLVDPYWAEDESPAKFSPKFNYSAEELLRKVDFNINGDDLIVFLHIQKTGGTTFGRHLVRNIRLEQPCECKAGQKKCTCHRPGKKETWLFSRFSTGWSCGLHADWTELTNCVPAVVDNKKEIRLRPLRSVSPLHWGAQRTPPLPLCVIIIPTIVPGNFTDPTLSSCHSM